MRKGVYASWPTPNETFFDAFFWRSSMLPSLMYSSRAPRVCLSLAPEIDMFHVSHAVQSPRAAQWRRSGRKRRNFKESRIIKWAQQLCGSKNMRNNDDNEPLGPRHCLNSIPDFLLSILYWTPSGAIKADRFRAELLWTITEMDLTLSRRWDWGVGPAGLVEEIESDSDPKNRLLVA